MQNSSAASQNYIIDEFIDAHTVVQTRIYIIQPYNPIAALLIMVT
jgi:hypothetical protein